VIRGGGWNYNAGFLRSAGRNIVDADDRYDDIGLRLVRTLP
jgi:formylglycine-generating enzyme required for sulfatase activity